MALTGTFEECVGRLSRWSILFQALPLVLCFMWLIPFFVLFGKNWMALFLEVTLESPAPGCSCLALCLTVVGFWLLSTIRLCWVLRFSLFWHTGFVLVYFFLICLCLCVICCLFTNLSEGFLPENQSDVSRVQSSLFSSQKLMRQKHWFSYQCRKKIL